MFDKLREACGVFGIFGHPEAAKLTYLGLYALQHRGQESAGIAASDGRRLVATRAMGYVADVFHETDLAGLTGSMAIGHVRYSTAGESKLVNAQPILIDCQHGPIAIATTATWSTPTNCATNWRARARSSRRPATPR